MFLCSNKKNIFLIPPIWSYEFCLVVFSIRVFKECIDSSKGHIIMLEHKIAPTIDMFVKNITQVKYKDANRTWI